MYKRSQNVLLPRMYFKYPNVGVFLVLNSSVLGLRLVPERDCMSVLSLPLQSLAKDLAEAESQHAHALRSHLENLEKLLQLQEYRISSLEDLYDNEQYELEEEFEGER